MSEQPPHNSNIQKRIKQLENQNIKFKSLLINALDVSEKEASGISRLQEEANYLKKTIENLEVEKLQLENDLTAVLEGSHDSEMRMTVRKLEEEHYELKLKLDEVLKEIDRENEEIENLREEDRQLKEIMVTLENEKKKLLEEIKSIEATDPDGKPSEQSIHLYEKLSQLENTKASLSQNLQVKDSDLPPSDVISNFKMLEKTYKNYVEALQEHNSLKEKVSELEEKNEELVKIVAKTDSKDAQLQSEIKESIIKSNTELLQKISSVRSKLLSNLEVNSDFMKMLETPELVESRISQLESEKSAIYSGLEKTLEDSTYEVSQLSENISDPEIKRLINEIEIQKSVLLSSLKSLRIKVEPLDCSICDLQLPSIPETTLEMHNCENRPAATSGLHELESKNNLTCADIVKGQIAECEDEHKRLTEEISRLEQERELLLMQLQSVSEASTQPLEEGGTRNERQLQTQSELHSTFMNEESSHEVLLSPNYDDATNQLYADEEARLEQRIRELETENARIKRELDDILTEIKNDKSEMSELQITGLMLKQRIEELENLNKNATEEK